MYGSEERKELLKALAKNYDILQFSTLNSKITNLDDFSDNSKLKELVSTLNSMEEAYNFNLTSEMFEESLSRALDEIGRAADAATWYSVAENRDAYNELTTLIASMRNGYLEHNDITDSMSKIASLEESIELIKHELTDLDNAELSQEEKISKYEDDILPRLQTAYKELEDSKKELTEQKEKANETARLRDAAVADFDKVLAAIDKLKIGNDAKDRLKGIINNFTQSVNQKEIATEKINKLCDEYGLKRKIEAILVEEDKEIDKASQTESLDSHDEQAQQFVQEIQEPVIPVEVNEVAPSESEQSPVQEESSEVVLTESNYDFEDYNLANLSNAEYGFLLGREVVFIGKSNELSTYVYSEPAKPFDAIFSMFNAEPLVNGKKYKVSSVDLDNGTFRLEDLESGRVLDSAYDAKAFKVLKKDLNHDLGASSKVEPSEPSQPPVQEGANEAAPVEPAQPPVQEGANEAAPGEPAQPPVQEDPNPIRPSAQLQDAAKRVIITAVRKADDKRYGIVASACALATFATGTFVLAPLKGLSLVTALSSAAVSGIFNTNQKRQTTEYKALDKIVKKAQKELNRLSGSTDRNDIRTANELQYLIDLATENKNKVKTDKKFSVLSL